MTKNERRIVVTAVPRQEPDLRRLARCIIDLAIEQHRAAKRESEGIEAEVQEDAA